MRSSPSSPSVSLSSLVLGACFFGAAQAHFSPWMRSMYGVGGSRQGMDWLYSAGDPVAPIGPGILSQDDWWFRGPAFRALAPPAGEVTDLPAGGTITLELACHVAWTSMGWATTTPGSYLDACPGAPGPFHADPLALQVIPSEIAGCALGIANVDNIEDTNMDNIVIFSVQPNCVQSKMTSFDIPEKMPACTGAKCICGWFWVPENGQANFFMTAFDCSVSNVSPDATGFATLSDAKYCAVGDSSCGATGAQRPLYAYNANTNIEYPAYPYVFNNARPGYHPTWGFQPGAQNNIFLPAKAASGPLIPLPPLGFKVGITSVASANVVADPKFNAATSATATSSASSSTIASSTATPAPSTTSMNPRIVALSSRISLASASRAQASAASARMAQISSRHASALAIQATKTGEYHARRTVALTPMA